MVPVIMEYRVVGKIIQIVKPLAVDRLATSAYAWIWHCLYETVFYLEKIWQGCSQYF